MRSRSVCPQGLSSNFVLYRLLWANALGMIALIIKRSASLACIMSYRVLPLNSECGPLLLKYAEVKNISPHILYEIKLNAFVATLVLRLPTFLS